MAYVFPPGPTPGQRYPANPGIIGSAQYFYEPTYGVWNTVDTSLKLNNQNAFNNYVWPNTAGNPYDQLTTDGTGVLSWMLPSEPEMRPYDDISSMFDDTLLNFPLTIGGVSYTPEPLSDIVVFLGGVFQEPGVAYNILPGPPCQIAFVEPPLIGTTFYAATLRDQTQPN